MKLTTDFCIYRGWSKKMKEARANDLVETIRAFAGMDNLAFWNAETCGDEHCVVVFAQFGAVEKAAYIKANSIEDEIRKWVGELKDWCSDDADTNIDEEELACKNIRVEISDLQYEGGLQIETYNKDDELEFGLFVLPIARV